MSKPDGGQASYPTWMIATGDGAYIGRYWRYPVPLHLGGHRFAAWPTRVEARAELTRVRLSFPRASVRRVTVTITEDNDG